MPPVPADAVALPADRAPPPVAFLCLTVEPAARGATVLLGERPEAPTLDALAAGPGMFTEGLVELCRVRLAGKDRLSE